MVENLVNWKRMDSSKVQYDREQNLEIEEAYQRKVSSYMYHLHGVY